MIPSRETIEDLATQTAFEPRPLGDYSLARLNRLTDEDLNRELHPLLRSNDRPGVETLRAIVASVLDSWLRLSDDERQYTERLQTGDLRPELLFPSDAEMAGRLRQHPALLWKAENARQHSALGPSPLKRFDQAARTRRRR